MKRFVNVFVSVYVLLSIPAMLGITHSVVCDDCNPSRFDMLIAYVWMGLKVNILIKLAISITSGVLAGSIFKRKDVLFN